MGLFSMFKKLLFAFLRRLLYVVSFPIAFILSVIRPIIRIRLIGLQSFRIGHYALNTELMLCTIDAKTVKCTQKNITLFYNFSKSCNTQLYKMWKRCIPMTSFSLLANQVDEFLSRILGKQYREDEIKKIYESCADGAIDRFGLLRKISKPHLQFIENEKIIAKNWMEKLGIPSNAKYVCLIVRDSGYLKNQYPENNWSYHDHRNADILNYEKAALYLANKGYYVLRMGKFVNKAFEIAHGKVIDYATHPSRSDFMDVYLSATCEFCISTVTGLDCVSQIFRRPILFTNVSPIFSETLMWYPCTLFIPKLLKNVNTGQFLTLSETAEACSSVKHNILSQFYEKNIIIVENTPDQLLAVVKQMEAQLTQLWNVTDSEKLLQEQYWTHYKKICPVFVEDIYIKIGTKFLRENSMLMN